MIETLPDAVKDWLESSPDVVALVGPRIFPLHLPQSCLTFPAILYQVGFQTFPSHLDGGDGTTQANVQISCIADTYAQAEPVALAVRALDSINPPAGFDVALFADEGDDADLVFPGSDQRRVQITVNFDLFAQVPVFDEESEVG